MEGSFMAPVQFSRSRRRLLGLLGLGGAAFHTPPGKSNTKVAKNMTSSQFFVSSVCLVLNAPRLR
jgi:hypothetical protein